MAESVNEQLDKDFDKWVKWINKALDDKFVIKIIKCAKLTSEKKEYQILSIDIDKMKAHVKRVEDGKSGSLSVDSYDLEQLYEHLPILYRDENDIKEKEIKEDERKKKKEAKKVKKETIKKEAKNNKIESDKVEDNKLDDIEVKKPEKNKKIKLTDFVRDYIKDNQGCEYKIIDDAVNKEGLVPPPYGLKYYLKLISERGFKKGMKLSIKENKYYIEFEK